MSNQERQRILREAGPAPAEAEKQEGARESRERLGQSEGDRKAEEQRSSDESAPLPEDDESKPRPRR